ncbi:4-(cytidine 5'-diphospho)-2-C-methyl-D-erythritol kinase [Citreicella sp. C3M06]|uniref:4-(cytidine 5'-diphospho)-2-C-methyl-D-erythritol kinase n=1 Tax=Citreicella sp. C3M06 TaxID=2841564 RepID=UPI001C097DF0|nr:4-(cytidine 5'-diphospho)-2-C-methyl-D-erythritol kinase [Citreicella sp. C3M06]MBU2961937.1 4-(cytidine 5'-diphospho)-2-C-methyl-D-erythritol kinase [Citreicella sp. C3M06]
MAATEVFAPAKINLALHVTGRRADGYHLLESLVVFGPVGDVVQITPGNGLSLRVIGPEAAGVPSDMSNLALRAAALLGQDAALTLDKRLPSSSGIGGGSADAAAALRGMAALTGREIDATQALALGADVPMCLDPVPLRVGGIGEQLTRINLPSVAAVLVNPRRPVSTPEVFKALQSRENSPIPALPKLSDAAGLIAFLRALRNDLEAPAIRVEPMIRIVLSALGAQRGCGLARMSGSGATCFGLFAREEDAQRAAENISREKPDWWVAGGLLGDQAQQAAPRMPHRA